MRYFLPLLTIGFLVSLGLTAAVVPTTPAYALECSVDDPDYCTTCEKLEKVYFSEDKNYSQIRGRSVWTPLYAAYFRDCLALATSYLNAGAHPAIGGMEGDMLATVISWDRFEVDQRKTWVELLVRAGARLDSPEISGRTTRNRLMQEYGPRDDIMQLIKIAEAAGG